MKNILNAHSVQIRKVCLRALIILSALLWLFWGGMAHASVSFSWQKSDQSTGYRLYVGQQSRTQTTTETGAEYDQYYDLNAGEVCSTDSNRPACESVSEDEVSCVSLDEERPRCTVSGLSSGHKYFSLTAYNDYRESGYSAEIHVILDQNGNVISQQNIQNSLIAAYNLLLLK